MLLEDILAYTDIVKTYSLNEEQRIEIKDICFDSRRVKEGSLFVCLEGSSLDGHDFAVEAVKKGAVCVVASKKIKLDKKVPLIIVKDTRKALSTVSANFFSYPCKELKIIGITGTKGKTSTAFMLASILKSAGLKCGVIGTLGIFVGDEFIKTNNTTPESYYVQKYLRIMANKGIEYAIMEVSSIGLKNHRVDNIFFDSAVFTNFSFDHVGSNEHKNIEEYLESKALLFSRCKKAFINKDDEKYSYIEEKCKCKDVKFFGINNKGTDLFAYNINFLKEEDRFFTSFFTGGIADLNVKLSSFRKFNVYNALAAILVAKGLEIDKKFILDGLKNFSVKGRVESIDLPRKLKFKVIIDYAHTAKSLESLLSSLIECDPKRLVVVFGAGGNRSKEKRPAMGKVCGNLAELSVITADNSRFEKTLDIIKDIEKGIKETGGKYLVIPERREAIKYALLNALEGDLIVLAGKGHETYEEINGKKIPFDERKIVEEIINEYF